MPSPARIIRTDFWFRQKLPPLLALAYALLLVGGVEPVSAFKVLPLTVLCICFVAAYGHVINDIFDVEMDAAAGKRNSMAGVSTPGRLALLTLLLAGGFACLAVIGAQSVLLALLGVNYLLPTLYSAPPTRFKERGLSSVLSDLFAAHVVPMVIVGLIFREVSAADPALENRLIVAATCWTFFVGLRGILVHQAVDSANDLAANVITFGGRMGREKVRAFVVRLGLPLEGLALAVFLYLLFPFSLVLAGVVLFYAVGEISRMWRGVPLPHIFPEEPGRERHVPFLKNDFHEVWLPAALALQLAIDEPLYANLFIVHVILFRRAIQDVTVLLGKFAQAQFGGLFGGAAASEAAKWKRDA